MNNRNNTLESILTSFGQFASTSWHVTKYVWKHTFKITVASVIGYELLKSQTQSTPSLSQSIISSNGLLDTLICNKQPYFQFQQQCAAFDETFQFKLNPHSYQNQLFEKIKIKESFQLLLSDQEELELRTKVYNIILKSVSNDAEKSERLFTVLNSINFQIIIVDYFAENPYGVGLYREYENTLYLHNPNTLLCDDFSTTIAHEIHHAYNGIINSNGDPIGLSGGIENSNISNPFQNNAQRSELWSAIQSGDKFVTGTFYQWHKKAKAGTLNDDQSKLYNNYTMVLNHSYDARCAADMFSTSMKSKLVRGNKVNISPNMNLYITGTLASPYGIVGLGNLVADPSINHVEAFILDTKYRIYSIPKNYRDFALEEGIDFESLVTTETDAEINALPTSIIEAFYPAVMLYHDKREKEFRHSVLRRFSLFERSGMKEEIYNAEASVSPQNYKI